MMDAHRTLRRDWLRASLGALACATLGSGCTQAPVAPIARASGPVRLNLNESPYGPSPAALRAVRDELGSLARYTGAEAVALRAKIASLEGVTRDAVLLGEVLEPLGAHLVRAPGPAAEIVFATPGYTALADAATAAGGAAIGVPLDRSLGSDLPALLSRIGPATRAVFLVNPHNPSGVVADAAALRDFVALAAQRTLVIVDEAYLEYVDDFAARTCASFVARGQNVLVFRTFSKIHGLAGLPFGYALAPFALAEQLRKRGVDQPRSLDRLAVAAASASLGDPAYVADVRAKVAVERARWHAVLDRLRLVRADARASFVFFESGRPHAALAAAMLARGIDIGRAFPPFDRWARISIGLPEENARAQAALAEVLAAP